jgi:hypothetical protein
MSSIEIQIPEYLSIGDWKYFNSLEHLSDTEKMITLISHMTDKEMDEVRTWKPTALTNVYKTLLESFQDLEPQFYPIFELDGVKYGYNPMTKMSLGEYMDIERLAVKSQENLEEIMAILYRPITKDRFNGLKWAFKNTYKVALGEAENLFKYYDVEEYDSKDREHNAKLLSNIPASLALGALSFFLVVGSSSLINSQTSSLNPQEKMKMMKEMNKGMASMNIGGGLLLFITSQQHPSFQSQDRKQLLTSTSSLSSTGWLLNKIKLSKRNKEENKKKELTE